MTETSDARSAETSDTESEPIKPSVPGPPQGDKQQQSHHDPSSTNRNSLSELAAVGLALVLGALGFASGVFWIAAMVAMAIAFGLILADRRASRTARGVIPEMVATVAKEISDITQAVSSPAQEVEKTSGENQPADNESRDIERVAGQPQVPVPAVRPDPGQRSEPDCSQQSETNGARSDSPVGKSRTDVEATSEENQAADHEPMGTERVEGRPQVPVPAAQPDPGQETETNGAGPDSPIGESQANADTAVPSDDGPPRPDRAEPDEIETQSPPQSTKSGSSPSELLEIWHRQVEILQAQAGQSTAAAPFGAASTGPFSMRIARSADRLADRSIFLRPVRKRFYRLATLLSRTIVQLGAPPPQEKPQTDVEGPMPMGQRSAPRARRDR
jgi:hypothetical protein